MSHPRKKKKVNKKKFQEHCPVYEKPQQKNLSKLLKKSKWNSLNNEQKKKIIINIETNKNFDSFVSSDLLSKWERISDPNYFSEEIKKYNEKMKKIKEKAKKKKPVHVRSNMTADLRAKEVKRKLKKFKNNH